MKKISVIIPCYNATKYLSDLMDSFAKQTIGIESLELIFVNDASTDNTYDVLLGFEKEYPEDIMVINLSENGRQGTARNIGLSYASCSYISFVDADDYIEANMYEILWEKAEKYHCDMVGGLVQHHIGNRAEIMPNHLTTERHVRIEDARGRMEMILNGNNGGIVSKLYKKELLLTHEIYFPQKTFFEDNYWLGIVSLYIEDYYICNRVVYHYVDRPTSTVNQKNEKAIEQRLNMEVQRLHAYVERGFFKDYYLGIEALFCRSYYVDTLISMYSLWHEIPQKFYDMMREEMVSLFPHVKENPMLLDKDLRMIQTAFSPVSIKQLEQMVLAYVNEE